MKRVKLIFGMLVAAFLIGLIGPVTGDCLAEEEAARGAAYLFGGLLFRVARRARVMRSRNPPSRRKACSSWRIC